MYGILTYIYLYKSTKVGKYTVRPMHTINIGTDLPVGYAIGMLKHHPPEPRYQGQNHTITSNCYPDAQWDWYFYLHENHKLRPNLGKYM